MRRRDDGGFLIPRLASLSLVGQEKFKPKVARANSLVNSVAMILDVIT